MPTTNCDDCGTELWSEVEDADGICPDCLGDYWSSQDHDRQAQAHREAKNRRHVVDNDRGVDNYYGDPR